MAVRADGKLEYCWAPQPGTQLKAILASWCEELFFGGARGGGKSDYLLGDFAQDVNTYGKHWKGIIFRKTYKQLEELLVRAREIYTPMGAYYKISNDTWYFPSGATLKFRHLENDKDAEEYQGHQYSWIGFDELPNWANSGPYDKLKACLRSGAFNVDRKRIRSSGNPGGAGHAWVKQRFIDPNPAGFEPIDEYNYINLTTGEFISEREATFQKQHPDWQFYKSTRMFIPSKLKDNALLLKNDPLYVAKLIQTGGAALVKAWLAGDWNAIQGAYFDAFSAEKHVIEPFIIPPDWFRIRAFDWGYSKPFCALWGAVSDGSLVNIGGQKVSFPRGAIIIYREYYGWTGKANEGLKITAPEIAWNIKQMQSGETMNDMVADPAIFDVSIGESIADQMASDLIDDRGQIHKGISWRPADNKRVPGWQQIRYRLKGIDGRPMLYFFSDCKSGILRTLPIMQYDQAKPEDLDTKLEDHAPDTLRYLCNSRPLVFEIPLTPLEIGKQWQKDFTPHNVRKKLMNQRILNKNNYE